MSQTTVFPSREQEGPLTGGKSDWRGNHAPVFGMHVFAWLKPGMGADPIRALRSVPCRMGWRPIFWTTIGVPGRYGQAPAIYLQVCERIRIKQAQTKGSDSHKAIGTLWQASLRRILQEIYTPVERGT